jgi:hypothetical protein
MIQALQQKHNLHTSVNLDKFKRTNMQQYQRIISVRRSDIHHIPLANAHVVNDIVRVDKESRCLDFAYRRLVSYQSRKYS